MISKKHIIDIYKLIILFKIKTKFTKQINKTLK